MTFIDLFAGIGGFHVALESLGHECVFASEIDQELRDLYEVNFSMECAGDITEVAMARIPRHDILCAGFPCQSFSKAGAQGGLDDARGSLFHSIALILEKRKPAYFILENVPNLMHHDEGRTWRVMRRILEKDLGYTVDAHKLSPHEFGTPQLRERLFIVGARRGLKGFNWPSATECVLDIRSVLDPNTSENVLPARERGALSLWQRVLDALPKSAVLPSFPIWAMEFGATYPLNGLAPFHRSQVVLDDYLGMFGQSLHGMTKKDQLERLPKYARGEQENRRFPKWKVDYIQHNRNFYAKYKRFIDPFLLEIEHVPPSWQKLEWNCKGMKRNLYDGIIQFRGSGIRIKRPNYAPALVASTTTQRPIIGWEQRYVSALEAARLQDLEELVLPESEAATFKALGNAVNSKVVRRIAEALIPKEKDLARVRKAIPAVIA